MPDIVLRKKNILEIKLFCDSITTKCLDKNWTFKSIPDLISFIEKEKSNKAFEVLNVGYDHHSYPFHEYPLAVSALRKVNIPMIVVVARTGNCRNINQVN